MRTIPEEFQAHLDTNVTTLCTCWIVERTDDVRMGFTDHDRNLTIEGIECAAASGFDASEARTELGLSSQLQDVAGALESDNISNEDIEAGRYDNAVVDVWAVNWADPAQRVHSRRAVLGEVVRDDSAFRAELRGLTSLLESRTGRTYAKHCDAVLGDERCGIDTSQGNYQAFGTIVEIVDSQTFVTTGLEQFDANWFVNGVLEWTSGDNVSSRIEIATALEQRPNVISLWTRPHQSMRLGDQFFLTAGCNKAFATCKEKFGNAHNFRGCPHMPGADFALNYATPNLIHDGSPLVE